MKQFFFLVIFFFMCVALVDSSLNCPGNADALDEFKAISSAALLEFLGDPDNSKLNSNEVSDVSSFYDKYKNNWGNADCNEVGTISGSTIKAIIEKYTGVVDSGLSCRVENPRWSIEQTFEGVDVTLTVDAPKCNEGVTVNFDVKERDFTKDDDRVVKNPDNAAVLDEKATTTWKTEWQRDEEQTPSGPKNDEPPEYYFTASLGSSSVRSGILTVTQCVDADRDGYSSVTCGGNDCKDNDASIHPNVIESCDSKDNNCNLAADEGGVCGYDLARRGSFTVGSIIPTKDTCVGDPDLDLFSTYLMSPALSNSSSGWSESLGKYDFAPNGIIDLSDLFSLIDYLEGADLDKDNYDTTTCHKDCVDTDKLVNPGAAEICDGKNNNCNVLIDELFDNDDDKYTTCGTKTDGTDILVDTIIDCNDADRTINPEAVELCDNKDNNCNRRSDEGGVCGYDLARRTDFRFGNALVGIDSCIGDPDMDLLSSYIRSPALTTSSSGWNEGLGKYDLTNDGIIDLSDLFSLIDHVQGADSDRDNYDTTTCHRDCKDDDRLVNPGAAELCDNKDNNCDGRVDEGIRATYYYDRDRDGYGTSRSSSLCAADTDVECTDSFGGACYSATRGSDCNDADRTINPGVSEVCDGKDNNCDNMVDYTSSVNDLDSSCGTDGLVATGNARWVSVNYACQQREEKEWRNVDYSCIEGTGCNSRVISTSWYSTGVTNNLNEGSICRGNFCSSSTLNYNFRCNNGQCSGASSNCNTGDYCSGGYRYFAGYCSNSVCSFNREYCQYGCSNGRCNQNPCAGVTCGNVCTAGQIGTGGTCSNGKCYYNWDYCQYGCANNNQCNNPPVNRCAGVTCQPYCNGNYKINTRCDSSNGGCVYSSSEYCQYGCANGQCKPQPQQSCSCRYQDQCLQNWQCTTIGGANYLCYGGRLYKGYQNQCR